MGDIIYIICKGETLMAVDMSRYRMYNQVKH